MWRRLGSRRHLLLNSLLYSICTVLRCCLHCFALLLFTLNVLMLLIHYFTQVVFDLYNLQCYLHLWLLKPSFTDAISVCYLSFCLFCVDLLLNK